MILSIDFSGNNTSSSATMELHIQNQMKMTLKLTTKTVETNEKPRTAPPAGADIIDETPGADLIPQTPDQPTGV